MKLAPAVRAAWCMGAVSLGCTSLSPLTPGVCGNYVIDEGTEDCDSDTMAPNVCAAPGEKNACHFVCDTPGSVCPDGFGCGSDGRCRHTTRAFVRAGGATGNSWQTSLRTADFDGDGNGDFLLLGEPNSFGHRPSEALFSHEFLLSPGLDSLPLEIANPALGAALGSGAPRDVAFADFDGIALLRGHDDRSADFAIFPSIDLPNKTSARLLLVDVLSQSPGDEAVLVADGGPGKVALIGVERGVAPVTLTSLSNSIQTLSSRRSFFAGRFDEGLPCEQVALADHDAGKVQIFPPCKMTGPNTDWNVGGPSSYVTLNPPNPIDSGAFAVDMNLDGHLDLAIGAAGKTYVAFGLGDGQFASTPGGVATGIAVPYELPSVAGANPGFPLAIGDLNADGHIDFVIPSGIVVSVDSSYAFAYNKVGGAWTEAVIADLNANGLPDVAACSANAIDIDFLNNAGGGSFGAATLRTAGSPSKLVVGDIDGDLLGDIVFGDLITDNGKQTEYLSVAFGSSFGPPSAPIAMGAAVGSLRAIVTGHVTSHAGVDPMADIGVVEESFAKDGDGVAILPGRASRSVFSLLPLKAGQTQLIPVSMAFGQFGYATPDIVVLGANESNGELRLIRIDAYNLGGSTTPNASAPLSSEFKPANNENAFDLRYGATVTAADLNNDGIDEVIVVGAYGTPKQAALVVGHYNIATFAFTPDAAQPFDAEITVDSQLLVNDLDGDGAMDIVLTTGSIAAPADLIVFWGNGNDQVSTANDSISRIRPDGVGVRGMACVRAPSSKAKDLLVSTVNGMYRVALSADRTWKAEKIPNIAIGFSLAVVDIDHDGVEDLAVQSEGGLELFRSIPDGE